MGDRRCLSQEEMVDLAVGKLPLKTRQRLEHHLRLCHECRTQVEGWRRLLYTLPMREKPSHRLKRKLFISFLWRFLSFRSLAATFARFLRFPVYHRKAFLYSFLLFSLLGGTLLLIKLGPSFLPSAGPGERAISGSGERSSPSPLPSSSTQGTFAGYDGIGIPISTFIWDPETEEYDVISVENEEVYGHVWRNLRLQEILLIMEKGSLSSEGDYQVWLKDHHQNAINLGLLSRQKKGAHLYYQGKAMKEGDVMTISFEPKGGSLLPTGPEPYKAQFIPK